MDNIIISEKLIYLTKESKIQYSQSKGLHLNSKDWESYINVNPANLYSFLVNGTIRFSTKSVHNNMKYEQIIKLMAYKEIEPSIFIMMFLGVNDDLILKFFAKFLSLTEAKVYCSCDAFRYFGYYYILTKKNSAYGPGESRKPKVKNPKEEGIVCKHLWQVLLELDPFISSLGRDLLPYYRRSFGITYDPTLETLKKKIRREGFIKILEKSTKNLNKIKDGKDLIRMFKSIVDPYIKRFDSSTLTVRPKKQEIVPNTLEDRETNIPKLNNKEKNILEKNQQSPERDKDVETSLVENPFKENNIEEENNTN